jgi:hypothetical protein
MAVALGALVVAMGGTAMGQLGSVSQLLTGSDVQDESLTGADIDNGSLKGADIATGAIQSSDVKDGSLKITDLRPGAVAALAPEFVVRNTEGNSKDGAVRAYCNPGEKLVSGGVLAGAPITVNFPFGQEGAAPQFWAAATNPPQFIRVAVVCMK